MAKIAPTKAIRMPKPVRKLICSLKINTPNITVIQGVKEIIMATRFAGSNCSALKKRIL